MKLTLPEGLFPGQRTGSTGGRLASRIRIRNGRHARRARRYRPARLWRTRAFSTTRTGSRTRPSIRRHCRPVYVCIVRPKRITRGARRSRHDENRAFASGPRTARPRRPAHHEDLRPRGSGPDELYDRRIAGLHRLDQPQSHVDGVDSRFRRSRELREARARTIRFGRRRGTRSNTERSPSVVAFFFGVPLAWLTERTTFSGRSLIWAAMLASLIVPASSSRWAGCSSPIRGSASSTCS